MATVTAIYENGVLRPLTPLALPEHTRVQIQVQPVSAPADTAAYRRRVREALVAAGLRVSDPEPLPATRHCHLNDAPNWPVASPPGGLCQNGSSPSVKDALTPSLIAHTRAVLERHPLRA